MNIIIGIFITLVCGLVFAEDCGSLRGTEAQVQQQIDIAKSLQVNAIRSGINEFVIGCGKNCKVLEPAAVTDLSKVDASYLKSKLSVFMGRDFPAGGRMITIIFQDRPDAMFDVWVQEFPDKPGHWFVLRFLAANTGDLDMKSFPCKFQYYLQHPDLNI